MCKSYMHCYSLLLCFQLQLRYASRKGRQERTRGTTQLRGELIIQMYVVTWVYGCILKIHFQFYTRARLCVIP